MIMNHQSVLVNEIKEYLLNLKEGATLVDCTAGRGGHIDAIIKAKDNLKILAIDKDPSNISFLDEKYSINNNIGFTKYHNSLIRTVHSDYKYIEDILAFFKIKKVDAIIMDLGFCSTQIDDYSRGFSFFQDASLDMRYDTNSKNSAKDIVNEYSESDLSKIFKEYSDEKFAKNIARNIVYERSLKKIDTTFELKEIVYRSIPSKIRKKMTINPATKVFQALRIEVNSELESLDFSLNKIPYLLNKEGIFCVISFHSVEDRIVKNILNNFSSQCSCTSDIPFCVCKGEKHLLNKITKKPVVPSQEELNYNPRARSAKLRVYERI